MDDPFSLAKTVCTGTGGIIKWDTDFMDNLIPLAKTVCTGKGGIIKREWVQTVGVQWRFAIGKGVCP